MDSRSGALKKLKIALVGIAVAIGLIGFGVTTTGTIPDQAQIVVFPDRGEWVPKHDEIRNMDAWTITDPRPLILGLLFGQKERWRDDGSWIY